MGINKSMKIMVVDDQKTMIKIIRNLLNQNGFNNIEDATSVDEALNLFTNQKFDLIISDWNMVPKTGLELLQTIRASNNNNKVPFIMVTAESKMENVVAAKEAGVDNYIVKPFNGETLINKLKAVFGE